MKKLSENTYEVSFKAITFMGDLVTITGEQTVELEDGRVIDQYVYNIDGYTPENGFPFIALKANLTLIEGGE